MKNKVAIIISAKDHTGTAFRSARKGMDTLRSSVLSLKGAFVGMVSGYGLLKGIQDITSASNTQAMAVAGMEAALKSMGRYTPEFSQQLQDLAGGLQQVTNFGDEATIEGIKFLVTYANITDNLMPRTIRAMADLAALTGGGMVSAANMLGKASMGMTGELRRVGITVDQTTYKAKGFVGMLEAIETQVRGQAAAQKEATGSWIAVGNEIGDLKEKFGDFFKMVSEPIAQDMLAYLGDLNQKIIAMKKSGEFAAWSNIAVKEIRKVADLTTGLYDQLKEIYNLLKIPIKPVWDLAGWLEDGIKRIGGTIDKFKELDLWIKKTGESGSKVVWKDMPPRPAQDPAPRPTTSSITRRSEIRNGQEVIIYSNTKPATDKIKKDIRSSIIKTTEWVGGHPVTVYSNVNPATDKIEKDIKNSITKTTEWVDGHPVTVYSNVAPATRGLKQVQKELEKIKSKTITVHVKHTGEGSRTLPLSEKINEIIGHYRQIPSGMDFHADFSSLSQGFGILNDLQAQIKTLEKTQKQVSWVDYSFGSHLGKPHTFYSPERQEKIDSLKKQESLVASMLYNPPPSMPAQYSPAPASTGSGNQVDLNIGPVNINVSGTGGDRDLAITLADEIDREIAAMITHNRSEIVAALGLQQP